MTTLREAAQQALEALQNCANGEDDVLLTRDALAALRAALAEPQEPDSPERRCGGPGCDMRCCQPVEEPVAFSVGRTLHWHEGKGVSDAQLFAAPPQRPAKPQGCDHCEHPLYAAVKCRVCGRVTEPTPPQRKPLSEVDLRALYDRHAACQEEGPEISGWWDFARAIERAHGIGGEE